MQIKNNPYLSQIKCIKSSRNQFFLSILMHFRNSREHEKMKKVKLKSDQYFQNIFFFS